MKNNKKFKQKGFTLIELSMVLVISSILFALFLQGRVDEQERIANETTMLRTIEEVRRIGAAAVIYYNEHNNNWPSLAATTYASNGVPAAVAGSPCSDAMAELIRSPTFNAGVTLTSPLTVADLSNYLPFIDATSPYGQVYTTRCDADNFYVEVWTNTGNAQDSAGTRLNTYQASFFANRSTAIANTCNSTGTVPPLTVGDAAGQCRAAYVNPTDATLGNVATAERVLTNFSRTAGGGGGGGPDIDPFLPLAGGTMTGDIEMTNNADINFAEGSTINFAGGVGASALAAETSINLTGFSEINLGTDSNINLVGNADINLASGVDINLASGAEINLESGSDINLLAGSRILVGGVGGVDILEKFAEFNILTYAPGNTGDTILTQPLPAVCNLSESFIELIPLDSVVRRGNPPTRNAVYFSPLVSSKSATEWTIDMANRVWIDNPLAGLIAGQPDYIAIESSFHADSFSLRILAITYCI